MNNMTFMPQSGFIRSAGRLLIMLALFAWLLNYANITFLQVISNLGSAAPGLILASFFCFLIHSCIIFFAWHKSLPLFYIDCPVRLSMPLHAFSTLTKYVPGGIWQAGSRVYILGMSGYSKVKALFSVIFESISGISLSAALCCLLYPFVQIDKLLPIGGGFPAFLAFPIGVLLLIAITSPKFYKLVFDWYKPGSQQATENTNYSRRSLSFIVFLQFIALVVYILGYYFCFRAYMSDSIGLDANFAFIVLLATFSGFIAIFSPAGLGVRESILYLLFSQLLDSPLLLTICLAPRFVLLLSELLFFAIARIFVRGPAGAALH